MSLLAYFTAQNLIDQVWVCVAPALSLGVYYYLTLPQMKFSEFYIVGLAVSGWVWLYCVCGTYRLLQCAPNNGFDNGGICCQWDEDVEVGTRDGPGNISRASERGSGGDVVRWRC